MWHRKARWLLRKVILNPPRSSVQMKELCNEIIQRRLGQSQSATAIVTTALSLWDDQNLVDALHNNPSYKSARDRIQRTAQHILPLESSEDLEPSFERNDHFLHSTQRVLEHQFEDVACPVCGMKFHCRHNHQSSLVLEEQVREFTEGSIGKVPDEVTEGCETTPPTKKAQPPIDWDIWFGPLVLATFAIFGLAVGVWSGDIALPKIKTLPGRAVLAITMMTQASNSLFRLLNEV